MGANPNSADGQRAGGGEGGRNSSVTALSRAGNEQGGNDPQDGADGKRPRYL